MGMQLPGWLRQALEYVGYEWPASDESVLWQWGGQWQQLSTQTGRAIAQLQQGVSQVANANQGPAAEAFTHYASGSDGNLDSLRDFQAGTANVSRAHYVASGIILTLKLAVIAQLVILAYAIAAAIASAGLASGAVVAARQAAKWAIEAALNIAVEQILS